MSEILDRKLDPLPVANYGTAVARALEWLGDRYLLAKPIGALARPLGPVSTSRVRKPPRTSG